MKKIIFALALLGSISSVSAQTMDVTTKGDTTVITITNPTKYLILPVEEDMSQKQVKLDKGLPTDTWMDVRLAETTVDYNVPFELGNGKQAVVKIVGLKSGDIAVSRMKLSNEWSVVNTDYYRPVYHHTPSYGWMNDANGMFYKDGVWNLYYQYNPYGSKWGNMHWGHAVSRDLFHWTEKPAALARDTMGHIFSGSSVVDVNNTAGYGPGAIIAFYTSASEKNGQIQCMAYSTDNGLTFTKYEDNPILTPFDGLANFRDPKVFWYAPKQCWFMIVSADKEMRFYKSHNLKDWTYISAFGKGYGAQPNQFECPDFFPMTVNGKQKWVMIVNINPGCMFGGSATEYFVGDFDGKTFTCDDTPDVAKFLDYGKDHYATVTFYNAPDGRIVALPWMSNWQYANVTPIKQYRGANALPRDLKLYEKDGEYYVAADASKEVKRLRKQEKTVGSFTGAKTLKNLFAKSDGAFEIECDVTPNAADIAGIDISNSKGEVTKVYFDMQAKRLVMNRTQSGLTDFGKLAEPHEIEREYDLHEHRGNNTPMRQQNSVNYQNDFALGTWGPLALCNGKTYHLHIFVDNCSVEAFVDGGRIAMTNLVFPTKPYNNLRFYSVGGQASFKNVKVYKLGM
ncbi:MAG: GH32 C-terminal domain-containing protein [Prevotella sp.]|nr:GH32 C-terminal domain-containing protein [Prevotella sp.]